MNHAPPAKPLTESSSRRYSPVLELVLARLRESYRRPETVFWVYGFPIIMMAALGTAFRSKPVERFAIDVQQGPRAERVAEALRKDERFKVRVEDAAACRARLRVARTDVIVALSGEAAGFEYLYDPTQPKSILARNAANDLLQREAGRQDAAPVRDTELSEPGGRYIDFLVPGLIGMGLLGGGLWGVGFAIVDMRIRKLLKRFVATPMKKRDFLAGMMISRLLFLLPEMIMLLIFARLAYGVVNYGSWLSVAFLILLGATTFAGVGLLIASRAQTLEAVSGLMNLAMLPMWIFSGIFFSPDRFPDFAQPFIRALPLTPLISALRSVMLEGATLVSQSTEIATLCVWTVVSFALALWWFRWN